MNKNIENALQWRYATKDFDPNKKISNQDLATLKQSLLLAPSSFGLQPWKFVFVENAELRKKLTSASWGQTQIENSSHLLVICAKTDIDAQYVQHYIDHIAKVRNIPVAALAEYNNLMVGFVGRLTPEQKTIWMQKQCYIALGELLAAAALIQVDACPMEGFDAAQYNEILSLKASGYNATVVCALGYRSENDAMAHYTKVRFPEDEMFLTI